MILEGIEGIVTTAICWRQKGFPDFPVFYEKFQNWQNIQNNRKLSPYSCDKM